MEVDQPEQKPKRQRDKKREARVKQAKAESTIKIEKPVGDTVRASGYTPVGGYAVTRVNKTLIYWKKGQRPSKWSGKQPGVRGDSYGKIQRRVAPRRGAPFANPRGDPEEEPRFVFGPTSDIYHARRKQVRRMQNPFHAKLRVSHLPNFAMESPFTVARTPMPTHMPGASQTT